MLWKAMLVSILAGVALLGQTPDPEATRVVESSFAKYKDLTYVVALDASFRSVLGEEDLLNAGGSIHLFYEPFRLRVEYIDMEELGFPAVEIADIERGAAYSFIPGQGWVRHVLSADYLLMVDPNAHPLYSKAVYTSLKGLEVEGKEAWEIVGAIPDDPLGILSECVLVYWIEKATHLPLKGAFSFTFNLPGLDLSFANEVGVLTRSYEAKEDIPDELFTVPEGIPDVPDDMGRVFPRPAPELRGESLSGEEIAAFSPGDVSVILFFDPYEEIFENYGLSLSLMEGTSQRGGGLGVRVIGVATGGDREMISSLLGELGLTLPVIMDEQGEWIEGFGIRGFELPICVLIDREGMVRAISDPFSALWVLLELLG